MACHEIAALRLGLMNIIGISDETEKQHELSELGTVTQIPGPLRSLSNAHDFKDLKKFFEASLADLEQKVATLAADDPKIHYYRALIVLTKKVELDFRNQLQSLMAFYQDLDEMHDFVHEIYPAD